LGESAQSLSGSIFLQINQSSYPLVVRCDFDSHNRVQGIFVYRSDM